MQLLSIKYILATFLIFVRVSSMIMTAPFFNSASFPRRVKIYFAIITSLLLSFVIPGEQVLIPEESGLPFLATAIFLEALVGVALGLVGQLVFAGIDMAGRLISLKITLSFAQIVNTMTQQKTDIVGNLFTMLAVLVFLLIDGDKVYINALARSFEVIPVNQAQVQLAGPFMLEVANYLFIVGVQIAAPFLIVLFLLDLSLAIFARVMPQANIMFIAIPIKLGLGFTLLTFVMPYLPDAFETLFQRLFDFMAEVIGVIA
ncbi:flagellar biosynthetic protein FliR [Aliifodinibius sp. S!AR15-10]|uniref:flagellar biosynthetic protein FliR n=1 Tax=Aliifodinibius sp. S!AR15-10 TaxID=2950437 RepID=UPI002861BE3D|nr:flagellar biosynthetic protein FliR [Aliifodinibius sp. S!AR15-10]MDR8394240.1 flagellar biosynthetic protein FliR [Aliifodinibius sp. S!AR15-10]